MEPQTVTAAKALSSAYLPISAVIVPEFLYAPIGGPPHMRTASYTPKLA
jgi:adenosylmethionine-8-amino-7-oxononanoate aminotransferase